MMLAGRQAGIGKRMGRNRIRLHEKVNRIYINYFFHISLLNATYVILLVLQFYLNRGVHLVANQE